MNRLLNYKYLSKKPALFRSITGLEVPEFDSFFTQANARYKDYEAKRLNRPNRKHKVGAGYPFKLSLQERLLMLMIYYRLYITSTLTSFLFNLDQSNVLKDIHKLEPLVREILPLPQKLHDKAKRLQNIEEIEAMFPEFKAFIDATEQEIPGQKQTEAQDSLQRKKKRYTVKTQLTVNSKGLIIHKSRHVRGSTHDYALYKHSHPVLPSNVLSGLDLGYLGIRDDYPKLNCVLP